MEEIEPFLPYSVERAGWLINGVINGQEQIWRIRDYSFLFLKIIILFLRPLISWEVTKEGQWVTEHLVF